MSAEVAEAIRQTRRTLVEKTWVPHDPWTEAGQVCAVTAVPGGWAEDATWGAWWAFIDVIEPTTFNAPEEIIAEWNDRQTDVGAVLGMTLEALITELCKASA